LLQRYAEAGDEPAFELLVWRHAQAVLGVCRRVLRDEHAAHDCFQATFLALARQAKSSACESVGGWLYRVAYRTSLKARRRSARRAAREQPFAPCEPPSRETGPCDVAAWQELGAALDEEINRLAGVYREVLVLRCLAGKSIAEVAGELGCPPGTVESRLGRARQRLRAALARRGFQVPAALLAGCWPDAAAEACVPTPLVASVAKAAKLVAAGEVVLTGAISMEAIALTEGVFKTMTLTKATIAVAMVLALAVGTGAAGLSDRPSAPEQPAGVRAERQKPDPPKKDKDKERLEKEVRDLRDKLAAMQIEARSHRDRAEKEKRLLQTRVELEVVRQVELQKENRDLRAKLTRGKEEVDGLLHKLDVKKRTVKVTLRPSRLPLEPLAVSQAARVFVGPREGTLADLKEGMAIAVRVKEEGAKPVVVEIRAALGKK
jgi:RNA polymerase sigma factor (sigma-70 family)